MMSRWNLVLMFSVASLVCPVLATANPGKTSPKIHPQKTHAVSSKSTGVSSKAGKRKPSSKKTIEAYSQEPRRFDFDISADGRRIILREAVSQGQHSYFAELKKRKKTLGIVSFDRRLFEKYAADIESLMSIKKPGTCTRGLRIKRSFKKNVKTVTLCEADLSRVDQNRIRKISAEFMALLNARQAQRDASK